MHRSSQLWMGWLWNTYLGLVQTPPGVRPPDAHRGWKYSGHWGPLDVDILDAVDLNLWLSVSFFKLLSSAASLHLQTVLETHSGPSAFSTILSSGTPACLAPGWCPAGSSRRGLGGATCPRCWSHHPPQAWAARGPCMLCTALLPLKVGEMLQYVLNKVVNISLPEAGSEAVLC